jgi:putative ABC transport system permease protein
MMLHLRFIFRELVRSGKQAAIFVLCVALSLATMVALDSFRKNVNHSILGDARSLLGGDILIHSHYPLSPGIEQAVAGLEKAKAVEAVRTYGFYSVIRPMSGKRTLFCRLKVVGPGYPLYGRVELRSKRPFAATLTAGKVIVEPEVVKRLGLKVGDRVHIGDAVLTIADVVTFEPDRPVEIFSLGPGIFLSTADLDRLQLIGKGSRVEYNILLKVGQDDAAVSALAARLNLIAQPAQERIRTYRTASSGMKRFFDNLFFFLSLISIFTLFLAGIGMQSSLAALLREKEKTLAVIKAVGAKNAFLFRQYFALVLCLGAIGSMTGIAAAMALEHFLPRIFQGLLPPGISFSFSFADTAAGMALGLLVVVFFTFLPLYNLHNIRPVAIFRHESAGTGRGIFFYPAVLGGFLILTVLVVRQLQDLKIGLYFMAGTTALIVFISLVTRALLAACAKVPISSLGMRQAVKSLFRPGNATRSIIVTLASALSVLLTIFLVQANLSATYIDSYPPDAPNLFFLDIQPGQKTAFSREIGAGVELFPVIRARLVSINGQKVRQEQNPERRGDSLTREFNLTYRDTLLSDEAIKKGASLFTKDGSGKIPLQVSILDTVAGMGDMHVNDILEFNIQGVPLKARVSSIRTRTKSRLYPFFYFVFPAEFLKDAPQTFFAALHIKKEAIAPLENRIVTAFPNISFINMADTAAELGRLTRKLIAVVNFFAGFSILAGALIMVGSIFATRLARVREAVYYKILGGGSRFVLSVFIYEHLLLGLFSSALAVILAQAGSWGLCRYLFDIGYAPHLGISLLLILVTGMLVIGIGVVSSIGIIRQKPAVVLREQNGE